MKMMPKGEAIPLGTKKKRPNRRVARHKAVKQAIADILSQKAIDTDTSSVVESLHLVPPDSIPESLPHERKARMTLTLRSLSKNGKNAMYTGAAAVLRLPLAAFPDKQAPTTLSSLDQLAAKVERVPRVRMTREERKAFNAAQPKPTLAERARKAQERADKLAKLAGL